MFLRSGSSWLKVTPFAIRKQLKWIKDRYMNIPIYVTENGVSDRNGSLVDVHRINYYRAYINEVLKGILILVHCVITVRLYNPLSNQTATMKLRVLFNFAVYMWMVLPQITLELRVVRKIQ
jgi:hypothetical protein